MKIKVEEKIFFWENALLRVVSSIENVIKEIKIFNLFNNQIAVIACAEVYCFCLKQIAIERRGAP